jgi:hypothetical protein
MIAVTYTISEANFNEAQKLWCPTASRNLPGRHLILGVSVILGGFIGWSLHFLPAWLSGCIGGSLLVLILVTQWRKKALRRYQFSLRAKGFEGVDVWIDSDGYRDERAGVCGGWIAWSSFTGWRETPNIFVLGRDLTFVTVPKSALSADQQAELRSILLTHMGT